jgi:nitronate monooxygenase
MLHTKICDLLGIELPIMSAGMGGVALAPLAAAVSEAGGIGTIALSGFSPNAIHKEIASARELTGKPLAVNLLIPFLRAGAVETILDEPIQAVTFFWGDPAAHERYLTQLRQVGIKTIWQCGSTAEALAAKRAGVDIIMAQGFEAGGHVYGQVTTLALIPEARDAIGEMPMIAAGGMADGRGLAAALALGADGAVFGTRFLATTESAAHHEYKRRILAAHADATVHTTLFDVGWPDAPHRVLRTTALDQWELAGRPPSGKRPGEGGQVCTLRRAGVEIPLVRYSVSPPSSFMEGDLEGLPFYAGQSVGLVNESKPAGDIVRSIAREAREVIEHRLTPLVR